ncbi:MAG: glutamate racemase [Candidatus Dormibacteraeota bacterium]|nr:glutamate racemase [Candidatus Dormibacteraeota bacterium]
MSDSRPIGVFDSGVGGLTVLQEVRRQLPSERLVYLADLAHFPYGPRPQTEVRRLALGIIDTLSSLETKLVVIACNTATAAALNTARERFDIPVVGVIAPGAQAAAAATRNGRIGVISTEGTLRSQEYVHAIKEANPLATVLGVAAPGLVELVEEGSADTTMAEAALHEVVTPVLDWGADTLVLGCTHYPLLRRALARVVRGRRLRVIDSAETTAARVGRILEVNRLQSPRSSPGGVEVLVTAAPRRFTETAARLFGDEIPVARVIARRAPLLSAVPLS